LPGIFTLEATGAMIEAEIGTIDFEEENNET
jgi:hypothetical protein